MSKSWSKGRKEFSSFYLSPPSLDSHEHELEVENCEQKDRCRSCVNKDHGVDNDIDERVFETGGPKMDESTSRTRTPKVEPGIEK